MKILIVSLNYAPEEISIAVYSSGTAQALKAAGHEVRVISGKPYYPQWRVYDGYRGLGYRRAVEAGIPVTHCPHYVPASPGGAKRILHHASFAASLAPAAIAAAVSFKPDLVWTTAPSLIGATAALAAARLCGAHAWLHVQDFEIDAAFATGLLNGESGVGRAARSFERGVLNAFDTCSSISTAMLDKLREAGIPDRRIVEFRNWADIDLIQPVTGVSSYRTDWPDLPPNIAFYSGNIANKQGIEILVEAARHLAHRPDIGFLICGDGPQRANLQASAAGLTNIWFKPLQPRERLSDLLGLASVHMLPQLADMANLVLPSKLSNMLASGRPVVATAAPGTALHAEVDSCGVNTSPGDSAAFAAAIEQLIDDPARRERLGAAARVRAVERWSRQGVLAGFIDTAVARVHAHRHENIGG
ncbi:WcaI family glycosyltransferase [Sphingomonas sp. CJ99]